MEYFATIFPTVGVAILFYIVFRAIILADRRERQQVAKLEEQEHPENFLSDETNDNASRDVNHKY